MQDIREISMIVGHHFNSICEKYFGLDDWSASEECATVASLVVHMVKVLNISPENATDYVVKYVAENEFREVEDHAWDEYARGFIAGQILGIPTKENLKLLEEAEELWDYDGNNECKYGYFQEVCEEVKKKRRANMYRTAIVDELGSVMYWCNELQGQEQIDTILGSHPEWCVKAIQIG